MPVYIYMDEINIGFVKNGKEFVYAIDEEAHSFYIVWTVSNDPKNTFRRSESLSIDKSSNDICIQVKNQYSFMHGSVFCLAITE